MGINAPLDATGRVLYEVLEGNSRPQNNLVEMEDQELVATGGTVHRYQDTMASRGTAVSLRERLSSVQLVATPAAKSMILEYAAGSDTISCSITTAGLSGGIFSRLPADRGPDTKRKESISPWPKEIPSGLFWRRPGISVLIVLLLSPGRDRQTL